MRERTHKSRLPSTRKLVWLLLRKPTALTDDEALILGRIQAHPAVAQAYDLAQQFVSMVQQRAACQFESWMTAAIGCNIPALRTFAMGLQRERDSILAALTSPWSNGQVEGQVNHLKVLKRQMYGRANFDLLRQRVLYRP
ncbi:MAG: hypothetical protein C4292_05025 [Nitrososphaera sp.]